MPRVTCLMLTGDRRGFVPGAVDRFLRQDYADRELLVVDDGADPVGDLMPADPRVRYLRLSRRETIGAKRNLGFRAATGELVLNWDDDDWMSPTRISRQVAGFLAQDVDVSGLDTMPYIDVVTGRCWRYTYPRDRRRWVAEPTFLLRRDFALAHPFPDRMIGSGTAWLWGSPAPRIGVLDDLSCYVGVIHPGNVAGKQVSGDRWRPRPAREILTLLGEDWPALRAAAR